MKYFLHNNREYRSKNLALIYHFTNLDSFISMINQRKPFLLGKLPNKEPYKYFVSFTRNPRMISPELRSDKIAVRIVIDPNILTNKYKIEPYLDIGYVNRQDDESEERIVLHDKDDWMKEYYKHVNILDSIVEINILNKPVFNLNLPFYIINKKTYRTNLKDTYKQARETINVEFEYDNILNKINKKDFTNFNFPINIVSKYTNPKYQDRYIIKTIN